MIEISIRKFAKSTEYSVELEEFQPVGGLRKFLHAFCEHTNGSLIEWSQGWEFGIGCMSYGGFTLRLCQSEFPFVFSFDCPNETMANELRGRLVEFFAMEAGGKFLGK